MNCLEINEALNGVLGREVQYLGCYLANDARKILKKIYNHPVVFIINTLDAESADTMGHWVTFCIAKAMTKTEIVILDSFGNPRIETYSKYFKVILNSFEKYDLHIFNDRIQQLETYFCGNYALYFTYYLSHLGVGKALRKFAQDFKYEQHSKNDALVVKFTYDNLNMPLCQTTFCLGDDSQDACYNLCEQVT